MNFAIIFATLALALATRPSLALPSGCECDTVDIVSTKDEVSLDQTGKCHEYNLIGSSGSEQTYRSAWILPAQIRASERQAQLPTPIWQVLLVLQLPLTGQ